jgi:hypothetical protein
MIAHIIVQEQETIFFNIKKNNGSDWIQISIVMLALLKCKC